MTGPGVIGQRIYPQGQENSSDKAQKSEQWNDKHEVVN